MLNWTSVHFIRIMIKSSQIIGKGDIKMKYDLSKKISNGAQRTLDSLSTTMLQLISQKNFDEITVNEICKKSTYPRATFYNYFDDKFDLLEYVWLLVVDVISVSKIKHLTLENSLYYYFDNLYSVLMKEKKFIEKVLQKNSYNDTLVQSFISYLKKSLRVVLYADSANACIKGCNKIPAELLADHFLNSAMLILDWIFLRKHELSKEKARQYLEFLIIPPSINTL